MLWNVGCFTCQTALAWPPERAAARRTQHCSPAGPRDRYLSGPPPWPPSRRGLHTRVSQRDTGDQGHQIHHKRIPDCHTAFHSNTISHEIAGRVIISRAYARRWISCAPGYKGSAGQLSRCPIGLSVGERLGSLLRVRGCPGQLECVWQP